MADFDMDLAAARVSEQADRADADAAARFERSGPVVGKASTDSIEVQVAPGGLLTGLTIHRSALRHGSAVLADQIVELAQRATRRAGDKMYHALAPVVDASQLEALGYEPIPDDDPDAESVSYGR
ncbi:YbaB/EbfC family DNA-binding protein [Amycolatopsis sp. WQ 127309]|uniref:YbaB/EbfC family DNA-binding protein n=1 Tax=Amycolatopsis sp. WQ 127309 TaxID=2932773 RepID=UPI001FF1F36E|nr:YbaB/EbfC family DNA-binding protein [Amycolatopsis sp. WQ 127309]UOZ10234.1 YbaB/EbfC family DNA-binding protein [Amycolatopsis sp. WQ 127309]